MADLNQYCSTGDAVHDSDNKLQCNCPHGMFSCIDRLFAYCKGGNFNIHIWAWFAYFINQTKEIRFYL